MVPRSADADAPTATAAPPQLAMTLREIAWAIHRRAPERAQVGPIPTTEIALLKQVVDRPGATVGELARALGLQQSNTSAALRALRGRGLVVRETSAEDRRVARVWITDAGTAEHEAIAEAWTADIVHAIAALPADERASLEAAAPALAKLQQALRDGDPA
jgi:DNA-binding MarR family transcriptional regulator